MIPVIRIAKREDLPAITRIYEHHVLNGTGTFEEQPPDEAEMTRRWHALSDGGYPYLVACVADTSSQVSGFAYAGPHKARSAYRFTVEDSIYLDARLSGQGIGRALLTSLIEQSTAAGYRQMMAVVGDSGNVGSLALHERLGFRHVGTAEGLGFKFGRWLDIVYLQRTLCGPNGQTAIKPR